MVAVQRDGKILVAGGMTPPGSTQARTVVARYDARGRLDPSFNGDGRFFGRTGAATAIVIQRDRKIVIGVAGEGLFRLNPDGTLDRTFGFVGVGVALGPWLRVVVQPDGKLVAAGGRALVRYTRRGRPDGTFSFGDGASRTPVTVRDAVRTPDGKIVVAGMRVDRRKRSDLDDFPVEMVVARFRSNGDIDASFGRKGVVTRRLAAGDCCVLSSIVAQRDGRLLIGGYAYRGSAAVTRLRRNGAPDYTFGQELGVTTMPGAGIGGLALGRNGRIVAHTRLGLGFFRLTPSGRVELSGGAATVGRADAWAVAVDRNDRIVVAGSLDSTFVPSPPKRDFAVARFLTR